MSETSDAEQSPSGAGDAADTAEPPGSSHTNSGSAPLPPDVSSPKADDANEEDEELIAAMLRKEAMRRRNELNEEKKQEEEKQEGGRRGSFEVASWVEKEIWEDAKHKKHKEKKRHKDRDTAEIESSSSSSKKKKKDKKKKRSRSRSRSRDKRKRSRSPDVEVALSTSARNLDKATGEGTCYTENWVRPRDVQLKKSQEELSKEEYLREQRLYIRENCEILMIDRKILLPLSTAHPTSALNQLCQKLAWPPPVLAEAFTCGPPNMKLFIYKAVINGMTFQPTIAVRDRKDAKANAAWCALQEMGFVKKDPANPL